MERTNTCPECGAPMRWGKRPKVLRYQGCESTVKLLGWWCSKCGEGILEGKELMVRERAYKALKAEVDGVLAPKEVAEVREVLGLSQRKASELLGGGPRAFQKYESGETAVTVAMSHLLRLLRNDPGRMVEIDPSLKKERAGGRRSRKR